MDHRVHGLILEVPFKRWDDETGKLRKYIAKIEVFDFGRPASFRGHPDNWEPAEGPEIELLEVRDEDGRIVDNPEELIDLRDLVRAANKEYESYRYIGF